MYAKTVDTHTNALLRQIISSESLTRNIGFIPMLLVEYIDMKTSIIKKILIIVVCLISGSSAWGLTRHGLVIGLGEYKDKRWSKIHGDSDVPIVKNMLKKCGYTDVITLINSTATKAGITDAFHNLLNKCHKGDMVYIHFSGHGQQITDVNGDEDDGWDEAWIPYDAMYAYSSSYKGEKHLIDDEIASWMTKIRNKIGSSGSLLLVVDACHSGDSSRDDLGEDEVYIRGGAEMDFIIPLKKTPERTVKTKENWLTLTACRDYQINCEVRTTSGGYYGMLSYALCSGYSGISRKDNAQATSQLQAFVNRFRHSLPQDITLTGSTKYQSLSEFFK